MKHAGIFILTIWTLVSCSSDNPTPDDPIVSAGAANVGPVVDVDVLRYVISGEDVTVTGTASDTDGTVMSQAWSQISGDPIVLSDDTAGLGSFTAPDVVEITDLEFAFTATDDDGFEGGRVVTITVLPSNLLRAQLGLLTGADVTAVRTTNTTEILESTTTSSAADISTGGTFALRLNDVSDDEWIMVSVSGGTDIDTNNDGIVDAVPVDNNGTIRAIARAAEWRSPGLVVSTLSEVAVQQLINISESLEGMSAQSMEIRLSTMVWELLTADLNDDETFDYLDLVAYQRNDAGVLNTDTLSAESLAAIADQLRSADAATAGAAITTLFNFDSFATIETNLGTFKLELFPNIVPDTAGNFITLSRRGFYDDLIFHRVVAGFVIQGGDPLANGTGGASMIGGTFDDEFDPSLSNLQYTVAMANSGPDTNNSQFFINLADNTELDFDKSPLTSAHSVFAEVVEGQSVIDDIGAVEVGSTNLPLSAVRMKSIIISRE